MATKLQILVLLGLLVLALACYFLIFWFMLELGRGLMQYLDAIVEIAALS